MAYKDFAILKVQYSVFFSVPALIMVKWVTFGFQAIADKHVLQNCNRSRVTLL